jgi:polyhydroxyalkanoate synthase subunit PhaC
LPRKTKLKKKLRKDQSKCPVVLEQENITDASGGHYEGLSYDRMIHAQMGGFMGWLSPATAMISHMDWLSHLFISPAKQIDILRKSGQKCLEFGEFFIRSSFNEECEPCLEKKPSDSRFQNTLWNNFPFNLYSQYFLLHEYFWNEATTGIRGVSRHHENLVNFATRQILDMFSPSNFIGTNPEVIEATFKQMGLNLLNGFHNCVEDTMRQLTQKPPVGSEKFKVGKNLAVTKGKVIYQNRLIELIQYQPQTKEVYANPILFVPAWIMKYYILDLSPHNSMVKYLVEQGYTVFMISWKNPTSEDRDLGLEDYINLGILSALNVIGHIVPHQKVHTVGYCIGGTLLMMAAAEMAKKKDDRLKSITLFAAGIDFEEAGELQLFIDESQVTYIEDIMWGKGYLDGHQMAGAFSMLRSIDRIWSRMVNNYLLGKRRPIIDLVAWNHDTTRLPYKMHTEYLRQFFLQNDLVQGAIRVDGQNISLLDIHVPIYAVSALKDHVAPWKSVYKVHFYVKTEITYVLTNKGHNSGIISQPGKSNIHFYSLTHQPGDRRMSPEEWLKESTCYDGSWWLHWEDWFSKQSGSKVKPPLMGNTSAGYLPLHDAPGTYVFQK